MTKYFYLTDGNAGIGEGFSTLSWSPLFQGNSLKIAEQIFHWVKENNDGKIIINIELANHSTRSDHFAIEVLLFLRCKYEICNSIICVGFEPLECILCRQPQNIILCSPGTIYRQLPFNGFDELRISSFDVKMLKPFIKPAINIEKIRHGSANWVGMGLMYRAIQTIKDPNLPDPLLINPNPKEGMTYYLYQNSLEYSLLSFYYDNSENNGSSRNEDIIKEIKDIRNKLQNKNPKILLVDDMAKDGWGKLFCYSIYNQPESENFFISDFLNSAKDSFSIIQKVFHEVEKFNPELLLLDLRLSNQEGTIAVESLDGYCILLEVKKKFPGLPVIMTTATNNGQTIKKLISVGADGVWTKQGLDEKIGINDTLSRLFEFIYMVDESLSKFLKYSNTWVEEYLNSESTDQEFNEIENNAEAIEPICQVDNAEPTIQLDSLIQEELFQFVNYLEYSLPDSNDVRLQAEEVISSFSDIFIDTNIFIKGNFSINKGVDKFIGLLGSLFIIAKISYLQNGNNPKVIIMNAVIDELIKHSKVGARDDLNLHLRAQLAYSLITFMFSENIVKTEINSFEGTSHLKKPQESVYADGYILDELANYLVIRGKKFDKNRLNLKATNVLLITNDRDLANKAKVISQGTKTIDFDRLRMWGNKKVNSIINNNELKPYQKRQQLTAIKGHIGDDSLSEEVAYLISDISFRHWDYLELIRASEKIKRTYNIS